MNGVGRHSRRIGIGRNIVVSGVVPWPIDVDGISVEASLGDPSWGKSLL